MLHAAADIICLPTPLLSELIDRAMVRKANAVAADPDHQLQSYSRLLPSGRMDRCTKTKGYSAADVFACDDNNVEPVVLVSTGSVLLHFAFRVCDNLSKSNTRLICTLFHFVYTRS